MEDSWDAKVFHYELVTQQRLLMKPEKESQVDNLFIFQFKYQREAIIALSPMVKKFCIPAHLQEICAKHQNFCSLSFSSLIVFEK